MGGTAHAVGTTFNGAAADGGRGGASGSPSRLAKQARMLAGAAMALKGQAVHAQKQKAEAVEAMVGKFDNLEEWLEQKIQKILDDRKLSGLRASAQHGVADGRADPFNPKSGAMKKSTDERAEFDEISDPRIHYGYTYEPRTVP